jgi:transposase-like protein
MGHSKELKAKVALEAIKGQRSIMDIADRYGVNGECTVT